MPIQHLLQKINKILMRWFLATTVTRCMWWSNLTGIYLVHCVGTASLSRRHVVVNWIPRVWPSAQIWIRAHTDPFVPTWVARRAWQHWRKKGCILVALWAFRTWSCWRFFTCAWTVFGPLNSPCSSRFHWIIFSQDDLSMDVAFSSGGFHQPDIVPPDPQLLKHVVFPFALMGRILIQSSTTMA